MLKKVVSVLATVILFLGFLLAFLPHTTHARLGLEESHLSHVVEGMILVVVALAGLIWSSGARISFKKK